MRSSTPPLEPDFPPRLKFKQVVHLLSPRIKPSFNLPKSHVSPQHSSWAGSASAYSPIHYHPQVLKPSPYINPPPRLPNSRSISSRFYGSDSIQSYFLAFDPFEVYVLRIFHYFIRFLIRQLNDLMESKAGKKSGSKSLFYEAPLGYGIEDVRPSGGLRKFKSAAFSNCTRKPS
ncbi:hypothetical protein L1887_10388 [Cichorium endivia]|nr:hypothetical protein L1887_10388 [Cichorium endivia]